MIEARSLSRSYGGRLAVDDLSFFVEAGEIVGLLGPNGAGKTTSIRTLAGIINPTSGCAFVDGYSTDRDSEKVHEAVGLLTESPGLYDRLTAEQNIEFFARFYSSIDDKLQTEKYLKRLGLWERRASRAGTFSKGMKQRLALARALVHDPKVLFLDEPTSGLDPEGANEVRAIIQELGNEGRTIFLSTHNLNEAESLCDRIAVINTKLIALDTPNALRRHFSDSQVVIELSEPNPEVANALEFVEFVEEVSESGTRLTVRMFEPERNRPELVRRIVEAGGNVLSVSDKTNVLEDVYLRLVREEPVHES